MKAIRKAAEKLNIKLSIHAPYWINLNSKDKKKIEQSKHRIIKCCEIGEKLGAKRVVFHPGYYGGMEPEKAYHNIKEAVLDMQKEIKKNKWKIKLAAETMGKVNVFGSAEDIANLVNDTGCSFCLDFAHILAREKKVDYKKIKKLFGKHKEWHIHFSGIEYGEKGEKRHLPVEESAWRDLLKNLPKNKNITIINESPNPVKDAVKGMEILKNS
jgi:deoxyribonuclease-4